MGSLSPGRRTTDRQKAIGNSLPPRSLGWRLAPTQRRLRQHRLPTPESLDILGIELTEERVIPVKNHHAILAEVEPSQLIRRKHLIMVPSTRDSVRYHGKVPRIMGLEDGEVVRSTHALAKGVINDVAGYLLIAMGAKPTVNPSPTTSPDSVGGGGVHVGVGVGAGIQGVNTSAVAVSN